MVDKVVDTETLDNVKTDRSYESVFNAVRIYEEIHGAVQPRFGNMVQMFQDKMVGNDKFPTAEVKEPSMMESIPTSVSLEAWVRIPPLETPRVEVN